MKKVLLLLLCLSASLTKAQTLTVTANPITNITCNGANNGAATINVSGCTGPYTYTLDGNSVPTGNITGLAPGSHTVNVTSPASTGNDTLFFDSFNGALKWSLANVSGTEGSGPNIWIINSASPYGGSCSPGASGNTMHIVCNGGFACTALAPNGEAVYNASGASRVTDRYAAVLNDISTLGRTNVQVKFAYRCNGEANNDFATLRYSTDGGTNWTDLAPNYQSTSAWTCTTVTLPVACENIANLKIGFRWRNNSSAGVDPPMNIDNVLVRADGGVGGPGCTGTVTFNITQPTTPLSVSNTTQTNVLCNGATTGSVTVAGAGGTIGSGYQYKIGTGALQSSPTFSGLAAGTYVITVQDANNCTSTVSVTITQPATALSGSITNQTATGCGTSTGTVTVAGAGGTVGSGYQYKIDAGSFQSSGTFTGLAAGAHTVTIQDANNCTTTVSVTITTPSGLTVSTSTQTNVLCFGNNTGSVTVAGANGQTPYQYKLGSGAYQPSGTFNTLTAGNYIITVLDANNCTSTVSVTITQPAVALTLANTTQTNVLCNGSTTGSVTVAGAGGTVGSGYQYKIGTGALQSSPTFSGLAAGTYTVTVQDGNNCTATVSVTITQPTTALSVSNTTQTNILCNGLTTGSVTVAGAGGTVGSGYQYKIGTGALQSSPTFSGLAAGTYIITVQDANSCTATVSVTITQPTTALSIANTTQTNVLCNGATTGSVTVAGAGGTVGSGYQYKIGTGALQSSPTFSGLAAGTYVITVQDANNCTSTVSVTITQPATALSGSITNQTATGCGTSTGTVTVAGAGGTVGSGYQYKIDGGSLQPSGTFSGLAAGAHTVTIQDANNCTTTVSVTITSPSGLSVSSNSQTNVLCNGSSTGSVTVAGASGQTPYQYKVGSGSYQSSGVFTGLAAGTYVFTVLDANNCTSTVSVTITQPAVALSGSISTQTNSSCGGNNGAVTIAGAGGTIGAGYQYKLGNGSFQASGTFSNLAAGSYIVTIQDANNCTTTVSVTISSTSTVSASLASLTDISCNGLSNGTITATGLGGTGTYQYSLDGVNYQNSPTFSNLPPGDYIIYVKDGAGCIGTDSFSMVNPPVFVVTTSPTGNVGICQGTDTVITITSSGSNACAWSPSGSGNSITVSAEGTYTVSCTDNNGCPATSAAIVVSFVSEATAAFGYTQTDNYHVTFNNQSLNGTTYLWTFPGGVTDTNQNPIFAFNSDGVYPVTLITTNACGSDTVTIQVVVIKVSVNENDVVSNFKLLPNPSTGNTTIQMNSAAPLKGQMRIVGMRGELVYEENISINSSYTKTFDFTTLSNGIYMVSFVADKVNISRKLVLQK